MPPFKSLDKNKYPNIDSHFETFCASQGVFSEDFLLHDVYELAALAEQQPNPESLKQGITEVLSFVDGQRQPWLTGMELLADALHNKHVLSTGCEGIDSLLGGGLRQGHLTELVGPSSSGKTQVCLQAASSVANKHMGNVVYLDTCNSFSPQRIARFVGLASNVALDQEGAQGVRLLIVDSISSLITPILGGNGAQGHALMISAGLLLKKLAHEHNLVVLVTNHTVGGEGGVPKPALGETWKSIPHLRLLLSRDRGSNTCSVYIIKHSSMAPGKVATFKIYG